MERARPAGYLHTGLDRYEVFDFQEDGLGELESFIKSKKLPFSFHVPFFRPSYFPYTGVTTFFLNDDPEKRALSFKLIDSTMHYANKWSADFVVTHLTWKDDSLDRKKVVDLRVIQSQNSVIWLTDTSCPLILSLVDIRDIFMNLNSL